MKKILLISALALTTSCSAFQKDIAKDAAKTALDLAKNACALYASQQGLVVKEVCATEEQLRPFLDSFLAASRAAGAARTAWMTHGTGTGGCSEEAAPAAPAAEPAAAPTPAAPAATPAQ